MNFIPVLVSQISGEFPQPCKYVSRDLDPKSPFNFPPTQKEASKQAHTHRHVLAGEWPAVADDESAEPLGRARAKNLEGAGHGAC